MNQATFSTPPRARRGRIAVLVAVNALLVCAAAAGLVASRAWAQPGGPGFQNRPRGNYLMVSGRASGVSGNLIYVIDTINREMVALRYQRAAGRLEPIAYRNLTADSAQGASGR
jgi:hypothetical protein